MTLPEKKKIADSFLLKLITPLLLFLMTVIMTYIGSSWREIKNKQDEYVERFTRLINSISEKQDLAVERITTRLHNNDILLERFTQRVERVDGLLLDAIKEVKNHVDKPAHREAMIRIELLEKTQKQILDALTKLPKNIANILDKHDE